jgi:murein L,D-transpeptidase YcbB/YkuD
LATNGCKQRESRPREITPAVTDTMVAISAPTTIYFDSSAIDSFLLSHPALNHFETAYRDFYAKRNFQYVWYHSHGLAETAYGLTAHLMNEVQKDSSEIPYGQILHELMNPDNDSLETTPSGEIELLLTGMYFYYAEKVLQGIDESVSKKLGWLIPRRKLSMPALLDSFLVAKNWDDFEQNALNAQYFKLKEALKIYNEIGASGNEIEIKALPKNNQSLKPGDTSVSIVYLRHRLAQLGYTNKLPDTLAYLPDMITAVNKAKRAYGLLEDLLINNTLITELNVPADKRKKQLLVNMERLRWVPARIEAEELILVNIPDFKLHYFEKGVPVWNCRVVVGTPVHKTVIFSGAMDYVVFSPYWYVPQSIIKNEIGLSRAKSAAYLKRKNMEWVGGSLREKPGPNNSLGKVKFIFPNSNSIYLHDTPAKDLFNRETRAFSHGCIRVAEPFELAKKVLAKNEGWTDEKIKAAMNLGKEEKVVLNRKLPVYIGYFTAFADKDGLVHFRKDIYGKDGKLLESLIK